MRLLSSLLKNLDITTPPSFSTNVVFQTLGEISILFFGIATSIIIARWLGPYGKGVINALSQFLAFLGLLVSPGLYDALIYHIAGRKCSIREGIGNFLFFTLIYSFPLTFLAISLSQFFTINILKGVPRELLLVSLLFFLGGLYFAPVNATLASLQRFPQLFFIGLILNIAKLSLLVFFLIALKWGLWGAMLPDWLLFPFTIYLGLHFLRDVISIFSFKPSLNKELLKSLLGYGVKVFLGGIFWQINLRADVLIVNYFKSPSAVGLYSTGVSYTELIRLFPIAVGKVLFPRVSSTREDEASELTCRITRLLTLYLLPLAFFFLLIARFIIPFLYGTKFIPSIGVVPFLLPGVVAWCYASQFGGYLSGRGHPEFSLYSNALASLITLIGDFLLIPIMGIKGAALTSSLAYGSNFLILLHFFRLKTALPLWEIFVPKMMDIKYLLGTFRKLIKWKKKNIIE
jgi:O-antigen/teichoic acid export membrane protein